jgi:predicted  nucleic acid-binding Zn-ribbon protein
MTSSNEPNDRERSIDRNLRSLNRRVDRLEYAQISPQEFSRAFDRVYEEIDDLKERFNQVDRRLDSMHGKIDLILRRLTGTDGVAG